VLETLTSVQTTDFSSLLAEAARILRPGGLLLSGEFSWFNHVDLPNRIPMSVHVPAISRFFNTLGDISRGVGMVASAEEVTTLLRASGLFKNDHSLVHTVPTSSFILPSVFTDSNYSYLSEYISSRKGKKSWDRQ
jgi:hypothetical protein